MATSTAGSSRGAPSAPDFAGKRRGYFRLAARPLHTLCFLLPIIALYEYGAIAYLTNDTGERDAILAHRMLETLFSSLGVTGLHLPAILTVVVLLVWHVLSRDKWRVRPSVLGLMWAEAAVWTVPLLVLGVIVAELLGVQVRPLAAPVPPIDADLGRRITIALGAGMYEELLFRMVGMAAVLLVLEDLFRVSKKRAVVAGVVITSIAFAWYHDLAAAEGGGTDWALAAFYTLAGGYFALAYIARGLGIAVAVHVLYDLVVLVRPFG